MKITGFDDTYTQKLGQGGTTLVSGSSGGSNSGLGGDVSGTLGDVSVDGLRRAVSLGSNLGTGIAVGDTLTIISTAGTPVARFATPSNSGSVSFGSNISRIAEIAGVGGGTDAARSTHYHDGIGTITASSSNTLQRGTVNLRAGTNVAFGLTDTDGDGELDTVTINSTAAGGAASGAAGAYIGPLESHTASSSATLDFTAFVNSTLYDSYEFVLDNVIPATNSVDFWMRMSTDGGATYAAGGTDYNTAIWAFAPSGTANTGANAAQIMVRNTAEMSNSVAGAGLTGTIRLVRPHSTLNQKRIEGQFTYWTTNSVRASVAAQYANTAAVNGFRFLFSSGNIASGTIRVYGIAK